MTAAAPAPPAPETLALVLVDGGQPAPAGLRGPPLIALAQALKELCYAAWSSEPQRAAKAADALALLAQQAGPARAADHDEVAALAAWTGGIALVTRGRMAEAVACFDQAEVLFQGLGQAGPAAQTQVPKIMALAMLGRHAEAAACAERTQRAFVAQGDVRAASKVSLNLGSLHLRHDAYADAARHYRDAARLFARVGDSEHSVMADIGLADALTALGELDEALRIYTRARARSAAHGLPVLQALVDESVALLALARGRYGEALAGFESARGRYEQLGMPQHLAIAEKQLADAYLELRLLPEALALFQQALQRFDALGMPDDSAWTLAQRGRAQALLGQIDAAAASFAEAARLFEQQQSGAGQAAVALARAELALARQDDAVAGLALADQALQGYDAAGLAEGSARAELLRAEALLQAGQPDAAAAVYGAALARARASGRLSLQGRCLTGLGLAAQARGDSAAALPAFAEAVALFEDQRRALPGDELRSAFLTDHLRPYRELLRDALRRHEAQASPLAAAEVMRHHERVRARVLGERLALHGAGASAEADLDEDVAAVADASTRLQPGSGAVSGTAIDAAGQQGEDATTQDLRARFNWLYRRAQGLLDDETPASPALVDELRRTEQALLERARRRRLAAPGRRLGLRQADPDAEDFDPAALCAALSPGEALVEYGLQDDELFAMVATVRGVVLQRRVAAWPEVLAAVRSARFQIETLGHGAVPLAQHLASLAQRCQARLARLHELVWAPLLASGSACAAAGLASASKLLVVAPAQLGGLPFAALHDASQAPGRQALGQRFDLALAPSARIALHGLLRHPVRPRRALVLAESSQLLHAADEARRVAALFAESQCLVDGDATLAALRAHAGTADVIHLACHAQFRSDNPGFSALHLHDAALTAELTETLHLKPGIVVLSGCETGLAEGAGGDEMVGLVSAFMVAGSARVLASLWPVDDAVTRQFMAAFYRALSAGRAPAAALRSAQADVMVQHPHPFYWAAFALYGGW